SVRLERRVDTAIVDEVSIAPSLLAAAGVGVPAAMEGPPILPKVSGGRNGPVFAQYASRRYSIRRGSVKLIETTQPLRIELYDLATDPGEKHDLHAERGRIVRRLYRELADWKAARHPVTGEAPPAKLDRQQIERLRSLGYLGGS